MTTIIKRLVVAAVLLCAVCCPWDAAAQSGHVTGSVVDAKSGEAMAYANVALMRPADTVFVRGATTDMQGRFDIRDVDTGTYLVRATFMGYKTHYETVTFRFEGKSSEDLGTIRLASGQVLSAVQVKAEKPLYAMDGEKNLYNTKEDPSIQTGTASDALQNAPGVEVDAEGNITLRGVSSVEIWINDRPSHMNEEALKQYIKTLPANAIERVEVITNPSARYSTTGGVINIVTTQRVVRNELLCLGLRASTTPVVMPWLSYVWANEKVDFNIYINGGFSMHTSKQDDTATLFSANGDTSRYQEHHTYNPMPIKSGYMGFNLNWNIDSMTHLSAWMGMYPYKDENTYYSDYRYIEYQPVRTDYSYLDTTRNNGFTIGGYAGAWYEHRFDTTGRKVSLNFNGNYWRNSGYSDDYRYYNSASLTDFKRHLTGLYIAPGASLGVDYLHPLRNGIEIEAGAEIGVDRHRDEDDVDSLNADGTTWDDMVLRSDRTEGTTWTPAAYITAQKRWGGLTAKLGLRGEGNVLHGTLEHQGQTPTVVDTAYFGLVPSIHLSYQTKTFTSYSLSYTRRFSAPNDVADITLFRHYDDYSFRTGNPNLLLSYSHNLEAAFNKYVPKFGNVGLNAYYRANTNEVGTMTAATTDPLIGPYMVNYSFPVNIGSSHTEGIEANITYRPSGFFNVRLNASVFNYGYNYNGIEKHRPSYSLRVNVWAKLWKRLEVFANARYSSPRLGLYSLTNANKSIDFGLSSDFYERRLSLYLNVHDIFGWSEWGSNTTAPQYQTSGSNRFNTTFVSLGLTWRIGKMELEGKARQGATDSPGSK